MSDKPMFLPVTPASENADGVAYIEISKIVAMEEISLHDGKLTHIFTLNHNFRVKEDIKSLLAALDNIK